MMAARSGGGSIAAFERFVDAHQQTPASLAATLRELEVDILIDLNGHTKGDHFEVLSHRPAPVQATWLGYAGTTAAPFVDWLIADAVVAPDPEAFTEKLALLAALFLPQRYQPPDRHSAVAPGCRPS